MKFKGTKPAIAEVDMTPMIDIVFQLIAFFMVITNFDQMQADERVKLPIDAIAKPAEVKPIDELVLNIGFERNTDGSKIDPDPFIFNFYGEDLRVPQFGPKLERESKLTSGRGEDPKDTTIVIRADGDVPTGLVQELVKMAQEAQYEKFEFRARQETK